MQYLVSISSTKFFMNSGDLPWDILYISIANTLTFLWWIVTVPSFIKRSSKRDV